MHRTAPKITLVGYGNQGKAWAANLRDSGFEVFVSGREGGGSSSAALRDGFPFIEPAKLSEITGLIALLMPDEAISDFFGRYLKKPGAANRAFLFAHGFSVVYGNMNFAPKDDVILVAPKGIGVKLRENFVKGSGVMGVVGVRQNASGEAWEKARLVAGGLGCERVGVIESSFEEETRADLLSEQVLLCGAVPRLVESSVKFLVQKGVDPRLATYECLHELKLIVDMMVEKGIHGMLENVSTAAKFGGLKAGEFLLPEAELKARMEKLWERIESGRFAEELLSDRRQGGAELEERLSRFRGSIADRNL